MGWIEDDLEVFQLAERIVDDLLGPGEYERLNHFSPAKGQMRSGAPFIGAAFGHLVNTYKSCPRCQKTDALEVWKYSPLWKDGEVWCSRCNIYVRMYDAG